MRQAFEYKLNAVHASAESIKFRFLVLRCLPIQYSNYDLNTLFLPISCDTPCWYMYTVQSARYEILRQTAQFQPWIFPQQVAKIHHLLKQTPPPAINQKYCIMYMGEGGGGTIPDSFETQESPLYIGVHRCFAYNFNFFILKYDGQRVLIKRIKNTFKYVSMVFTACFLCIFVKKNRHFVHSLCLESPIFSDPLFYYRVNGI